MPDQTDKSIRQEMQGRQTWQKATGWVLIVLGGGVLAAITGLMLATVFNWVEFTPFTLSARILIGIFVLLPILVVDYWLTRKVVRYRRSRKWLAEYERENPLPYRTEED